jgi:acyl phosphate:glycerol-3-phosphate acyltransferase
MLEPVAAVILGYLLGSISGSLLLGRIRGVDIRLSGSGNAGTTNALRTQGKAFAALTALIDVSKGVVAELYLGPWLGAPAFVCLLAATVGHCFPIYHGFRGGKGAGTGLGGVLLILPGLAFVLLGFWLLLLLSTGFVGPATCATALLGLMLVPFIVDASWSPYSVAALSLILMLIALMHRGNIKRWWAGQEYCFERARLLRFAWLRLTRRDERHDRQTTHDET